MPRPCTNALTVRVHKCGTQRPYSFPLQTYGAPCPRSLPCKNAERRARVPLLHGVCSISFPPLGGKRCHKVTDERRRIPPSAARRANHIACRTRKKPPVRKTLSAPYTRKKQEQTGGKQKTRNKPAARRTENPPLAKCSTARHTKLGNPRAYKCTRQPKI